MLASPIGSEERFVKTMPTSASGERHTECDTASSLRLPAPRVTPDTYAAASVVVLRLEPVAAALPDGCCVRAGPLWPIRVVCVCECLSFCLQRHCRRRLQKGLKLRGSVQL